MITYYLDSSAAVKLYVAEIGSAWLRDLLLTEPQNPYDAIHLATGLFANRQVLARQLPPVVFLCADERLLAAAAVEGLAVDNPNDHP